MFWRGLDVSCMLCTVWNHCQVICCFNYIKLLFYWYLIIVMLFGHPLQYHFQSHWNVYTLIIYLRQVPDCNSFVKVTLAERCRFHTAVQVFKVLYQLCPWYSKDWFVFAEAYTGHLFVPQLNNSIGKNVFFYRGAVIWNSLVPWNCFCLRRSVWVCVCACVCDSI